jgi:HD-GYP domain-containing protein (c-di-GMP phosphodiesterase class II)
MHPMEQRVHKLNGILVAARALNSERDLDRLLPLIVSTARKVVDADRCSLFLVTPDRQQLWSKVAQGVGMREIRIPMGKGIAGTVASSGKAANIPDAYKDERFNPEVDKTTGYRTRSILCVPMLSQTEEVVGVLQALNKIGGEVFSADDEDLLTALGGQAAAAVNNALLHQEIERLFEGFVRASVVAIESRDPTTAGHSGRVASLSVGLVDMLPRAGDAAGRWKGQAISAQERQELRYAALLHDFGKVGVRENVLVKANKLEPQELEALKARFDTILLEAELAAEKKRVDLLLRNPSDPKAAMQEVDAFLEERRRQLHGAFEFVLQCNQPTILAEGSFERLGEIAQGSYSSLYTGTRRPFLSENEVLKLSVRRGSLTESERREIESHVTHTFRFLVQIPWTRTLKNVPHIAYGHHEKLTGKGYPRALPEQQIPVQTRMMTISDIYDALTASDRPYKRAVPKQKAYDILADEAKKGDVDADLLKVFIEADVPKWAEQHPEG